MGLYDRMFGSSKRRKKDPIRNPDTGEYGADGDAYMDFEAGGPDINPELSGTAKYDVYDHMRFSDPAVRANLLMYKLPIVSAQWSCDPYDESPQAKLVAEACVRQFGIGIEDEGWLDVSWAESIRQALYFLDFGSMWEEIVWGDLIRWKPDDGPARSIRPIERLAPRFPRTIETVNASGGILHSIEQDIPHTRPIPGHKLVYYLSEREGANWFGTSMLRAMYGSWRLKRALMLSSGIAYDRYASGVPIIRHPPGEEQKAKEIGRNYRVHERAYVTFEGPPPPQGGWDMEIKGGTGSVLDPVALLNFYDEQMALGGLTMFSKLGTTQTGARAVGEVLADPYYLAVTGVAGMLRDQRLKFVFRRFVDVNFGVDVPLPKLKLSKIEAKNTAAVLDAIESLSGSGWNMLYRELLDYVCEQLGIPSPPENHPLRAEGEGLAEGGGDEGAGAVGEEELEVEGE